MIFSKVTKLRRELSTLAHAHVEQNTFSGGVLVEKSGKLLLREGYGLANVELNVPALPEHAFRIGSVAKTFTALAVLRLVNAGRLSVETPLNTLLPDFPGADRVTLHHLLSNTSGIADHIVREDVLTWCGRPHTLSELIDLIAEQPLLFEPGSRFSYSNANWALLAAVLEDVTEQPFAVALAKLVLVPLGLTGTSVGIGDALVMGRVSGYHLGELGVRPAAHIDLSVEIGAGALYSTMDNLYRLKAALKQDGFLKPETRRRLLIPITQNADIGYGYGVMIGHRFGRTWWGHSGVTFGFTASLTHYPGEDLTVIVLANLDNGSAMKLEQDLAAAVLGEPYGLPGDVPEAVVARGVLASYKGTYRTEYAGRTTNARVRLDGDRLCVQFPLLPRARLKALSQSRFEGHLKGSDVTFEFLTEGGRVTGIELDWSGHKMFAPKVT